MNKNIIKAIALFMGMTMLLSSCVKINTGDNGEKGEGEVELSYWLTLNANVATYASDLNSTEFAKNLMEKTGVKVKFEHPIAGQEKEQFALMIASEKMPDIVEYGWGGYPGGVEKALEDKKILRINDFLENSTPNFNKLITENPDIATAVKVSNGDIFAFPFVRGDEILMTFFGGMIRLDWLTELGLSVPETISEWETVLTAFKEKGVEYPVSYNMSSATLNAAPIFLGAYGVKNDYYREGDVIKFGPMEPGYKSYLETMNKWYQKGLLDKDFPSNLTDSKRLTSLVINNQTGATFGYCGADFGKYISGLAEVDPSYKLVPVKYPVLKKGDPVEFAQRDAPVTTNLTAISGSCKVPDIAAKFLDFGYSEEGIIFNNFGIENESYTKIDGKYVYTDIVTDPDKNGGLSVAQGVSKYARASYNGAFIQHGDYVLQSYSNQEQKDALLLWQQNNMSNYLIPVINLSAEDSIELSKINTDIDTYSQETIFKIIMQPDGMQLYDEFIKNLENLGIKRAIEIRQNAYNKAK